MDDMNNTIDILSPMKNLLGLIAKTSSSSVKTLSNNASSITSNFINNISKTVSPIEEQNPIIIEQQVVNEIPPVINDTVIEAPPIVDIDYDKMHNYNNYPFQTRLAPLYIGCLNDDPLNPIMNKNLGTVDNQLECINLGLENKLKYVGIIEGGKCVGADKIKEESFVSKYNCDYPCNEANTGYCGGFYYNQVYKIDETIIDKLTNKKKKIEAFANTPVTHKLKSINEIEFIIWIIVILLMINIIIT